ncbi:lysozyme C, milk isozyme-like [Heptranchias perlo]|uniref:lysozyme C, milk isozyme-like n=1 Tax=Heptranchias perlo TaxID=212740 RepID=UPI00355A79BB
MKTLLVLSVLLAVASAKILGRCQVADIVKRSKLMQFTEYSVADWVCLAWHESHFNTRTIGHLSRNGKTWSSDYGIFQINSKWWCDNGKTPDSANGCKMKCSEFLGDNMGPDIDCAATIVREQGMEAWNSWVENCKGKWIEYYVFFCFL